MACSAVAELASSADIAEVASSADLAPEVASSADLAEVASSADLVGYVTVGVTSLADPASVVTTGVAFREECGNSVVISSDYVCHYDEIAEMASSADLAGNVIVGVTSLADPDSVVTTGVTFREECGDSVMVPSDSVCDYDDYYMTIDGTIVTMMILIMAVFLMTMTILMTMVLFDFDEPDDYELYLDLHGQDGCGVYCISRGDVGAKLE